MWIALRESKAKLFFIHADEVFTNLYTERESSASTTHFIHFDIILIPIIKALGLSHIIPTIYLIQWMWGLLTICMWQRSGVHFPPCDDSPLTFFSFSSHFPTTQRHLAVYFCVCSIKTPLPLQVHRVLTMQLYQVFPLSASFLWLSVCLRPSLTSV